MKQVKSLIILMFFIFLCGCTRGGIGDKIIVKAILLDKSTEYTVRLLVIKATPSADAGNAEESTELLEGSGANLFEAFQQAETSYTGDVFYGQNELLLIGPNLQQGDLFSSCRYLAKNSSGRPNMAIYGIDLTANQIEEFVKNGDVFLNHIDQISQQNWYKTFLYQMTNKEENGILPLLHYDSEGSIQQTGLKIYEQGKPIAQWNDTKESLATLLNAQAGNFQTVQLDLPTDSIVLDLRTPKVFYQCKQQGTTLVLQIRLIGHIQNIFGENGLFSQDEKKEILDQINQCINTIADEMIPIAFTPNVDLFSFQSWFFNQNQRITEQMKQSHALYQADAIEFSSELTIV